MAPAAFLDTLSDVSSGIGATASIFELAPFTAEAAEAAHLIGLTTFGLGTAADVASVRLGGISQTQAYINFGVGTIGVAGFPLTTLGAAQYTMGNLLYKAVFGNSQAGWDALGSALDAMSRNGLGP